MEVVSIDNGETPDVVRDANLGGTGNMNSRGEDRGDLGKDTTMDHGGNGSAENGEFKPGISRIFTGFLLVVVLMTFGGLIAAYLVIATNNVAEWRPFELPIQIWISTAIIICSSLSYQFGEWAIDENNQPAARKWLIITTVLGAAFISSQLLSWLALTARGLYMAGNPYAGFFYILTGVHAVHVLGGITALGAILLRNWYPTYRTNEIIKRRTIARAVGWYWHFMGALWVVLFVLLGFWK